MLRNILLVIVLLFVSINSDAFIVNSCPLADRSFDGSIDGSSFFTSTIKCDDYGNCQFDMFSDAGGGLYKIYHLGMSCNDNGILIDGIRCFYSNGSLFCPGVIESSMSRYTFGSMTFYYPKDVPVFRFGVR